MRESLSSFKRHLLTGVSYAIPFVACGGILIAASIAFAPMTPTGPDLSHHPTLQLIQDIGVASFKMMLPVLAGYIAYSIASKPGLVAGFIGGYLADKINAGFIGALIAGLLAGYVVAAIKRITVPKFVKPVMPILIIPIISSLIVGVVMLKVIGIPIADFNHWLGLELQSLSGGSAILLGLVLGAMIAFDMGGPVNKAAFFFGAGLIKEGNYAVMGACAAAICTPPLGMGLATLINRKRWTQEERDSGIAALGMGMMGITEGAIPFAAADPLRVIPSIMVGSMVASTIAMTSGVGNHAPHGGPIVLPVIDNRIMYIVAIVAGTIVTAGVITLLKARRGPAPEPVSRPAA